MRTDTRLVISALSLALATAGCASLPRELLSPVSAHGGVNAALSSSGVGRIGAVGMIRARTSRGFHLGGSGHFNVEPATTPSDASFAPATPITFRTSLLGEAAFVDPRPEGLYVGLVGGIGPHAAFNTQGNWALGVAAMLAGELRFRFNGSADGIARLYLQQEVAPTFATPWLSTVGIQLLVGGNSRGAPISVLESDLVTEAQYAAQGFIGGLERWMTASYMEHDGQSTFCRASASRDERPLQAALLTPALRESTFCDRSVITSYLSGRESNAHRCRAFVAVAPADDEHSRIIVDLYADAYVDNAEAITEKTLVASSETLPDRGPRFAMVVACGAGAHEVRVRRANGSINEEEFALATWMFELPRQWHAETTRTVVLPTNNEELIPAICAQPGHGCVLYVRRNREASTLDATASARFSVSGGTAQLFAEAPDHDAPGSGGATRPRAPLPRSALPYFIRARPQP